MGRTLASPNVTSTTPVCPALTVSGSQVPVVPMVGAIWGTFQLRTLPLLGSFTLAVGYWMAKPGNPGNVVVVSSPVQYTIGSPVVKLTAGQTMRPSVALLPPAGFRHRARCSANRTVLDVPSRKVFFRLGYCPKNT